CYNSYFMNRTWLRNVQAICFQISTAIVENLEQCKKKSCNDKANVFNLVHRSNGIYCETQHCQWNITSEDYAFNFMSNKYIRSEVYSLSHKIRPCLSLHQTKPVGFPVSVPQQCGNPGYIKKHLLHSTDQEMLNVFCESGSNTFIYHENEKTYIAYKCNSNHEGTNWQFYDNNCYDDKALTKWWIVPYPGTPNCHSNIFTQVRMRASCQMSSCDSDGFEKVYSARDLRQCMLYACEKGYNVINFFSNDDFVDCELRHCSKSKNGSYDLRYGKMSGTYGYDVYALLPDNSILNKTVNQIENKTSVP
ncbi:unnamed protein product, partial [Owenia fusiformis]